MSNEEAYIKGRNDALDEILKALRLKEEEPFFQHDDEDWVCGLIMAESIVDDVKRSNISLESEKEEK